MNTSASSGARKAQVPAEKQFKVLVSTPTETALEKHADALGFHSANGVAAVYLATLAQVPPEKVFEVLAKVKAYQPREYRGAK